MSNTYNTDIQRMSVSHLYRTHEHTINLMCPYFIVMLYKYYQNCIHEMEERKIYKNGKRQTMNRNLDIEGDFFCV